MKELGITKGEWQHFKFAKGNVEANGRSVANCMGYSNNTDAGKHIEENYANAELVIDAGNTAQKCGLLPSELLQQRDELKEAINSLLFMATGKGEPCGDLNWDAAERRAIAAIKNTETK